MRKIININILVWIACMLLGLTGVANAKKTTSLSEQEALKLGTQVYIYGYPLVMMDMTRQVMTNVPLPQGMHAPLNQLTHARDLPNATFKDVTAPNEDMLYTGAWLDLSGEPYILHVPALPKRYFQIGLIDAWSNVFMTISSLTTRHQPKNYILIGPKWSKKLPKGLRSIKSPTALVWVLGRIYSNGNPEDYLAVHQAQDQFSLTPLSQYKLSPVEPQKHKIDPKVNMTIPVSHQVNALEAATFYKRLTTLMAKNPAQRTDTKMVAAMKKLGMVPGQPYDLYKQPAVIIKALEKSVQLGQEKIEAHHAVAGKYKNGWLFTTKIGRYGKNYLQRAYLATMRLGAHNPKDIIYLRTTVDGAGMPLIGKNDYVLHFPKAKQPPVKSFWSLTLYDDQLRFVDNPLNRYNRTSRDELIQNPDGSIDIYIQAAKPDKDKMQNWLPAPKGAFELMLRLYDPKAVVLQHKWRPNAVQPQQKN